MGRHRLIELVAVVAIELLLLPLLRGRRLLLHLNGSQVPALPSLTPNSWVLFAAEWQPGLSP